MYVFNKKILFESVYIGLTLANAVVGATTLFTLFNIKSNVIVGLLYFIISVVSIHLVAFRKDK